MYKFDSTEKALEYFYEYTQDSEYVQLKLTSEFGTYEWVITEDHGTIDCDTDLKSLIERYVQEVNIHTIRSVEEALEEFKCCCSLHRIKGHYYLVIDAANTWKIVDSFMHKTVVEDKDFVECIKKFLYKMNGDVEEVFSPAKTTDEALN